ncbi:DsbA family protein [Paraliomyxa miuraensis]|uniref:DsbA family protein n=1 Tax=Paraliomyxa miuraensis TaxID=376150 RepID=UPI00225AEF58|nr:thioredoxin domain-containing protein [Paraliomyxa miuraensis]MCX4243234.1 thioredoxin domain-containing protein [Paraliomyxa miuraensis]
MNHAPQSLRFGLSALLVASLALPACQGAGAFAQVSEKLNQIADGQTQILARLDKLESKVEEAAKAAPAAAPGKPGRAGQPQQRPGQPDPASTYKVPVGDAYVKGSAEALVTIVEWSDFQCPYCSRVTPTMTQLLKDYGDEVRVAFKHNPLGFHPNAMPAAKAAEAAGKQGKFWEMHDKLFENQKALTDENYVAWAGELGLNVEQFKKDMADPALEKKITAQQQEGATLGARGTPAFFVNGRFISGAQPVENFKKLIDEEKVKAQKLLTGGTPKAQVYDKVIANGKTKV